MQLFWRLMALVYPGLFNGSEKLNALELTKRMAWTYGGVAESLGIKFSQQRMRDREKLDYEKFIRFPNLSSIAAAQFAYNHPNKIAEYWKFLWFTIRRARNPQTRKSIFNPEQKSRFIFNTFRPFQVPKADVAIKQILPNYQDGYNGVMFSSKWLAEDMGVEKEQLPTLRRLVEQAHKECDFGDSSPADWWAIVLADGDGMGGYVSGTKLKLYGEYIDREVISEEPPEFERLLATRKRMGPATHVGLNRALLDFSNRIVPYITEKRFCGKVVYSGGDDVLAVLPLADLPEFLQSLRAAWCGDKDPYENKDPDIKFISEGGYWHPGPQREGGSLCGLPNRPLFTMGEGATMSAGIVVAHKSVPLPTVLEYLWSAEKDRAKEMKGATAKQNKDGLCFRVIYGGGNVLEALMKGDLLDDWWAFISAGVPAEKLAPVLYRLAEELPIHAALTKSDRLVSKAAKVIINSRDEPLPLCVQKALCNWLDDWEDWAYAVYENWHKTNEPQPVGCDIQDLAKLLRFSAFWLDKMAQQQSWVRRDQ